MHVKHSLSVTPHEAAAALALTANVNTVKNQLEKYFERGYRFKNLH